MHTQELTANTQEQIRELDRSKEAAILAEIAVRLVEHSELTSIWRTKAFLRKLYCLTQLDRECVMVFLHIMTGDLSAIVRSYEEEAKQRGLDKQAIQQQVERVIASLLKHFPELAKALVQLRHITAHIGLPVQIGAPQKLPREDFQRIGDNRL